MAVGAAVAGMPAAPVMRPLDATRCAEWDAYVERTPAATFFHLTGWRTVIERAFGHRTHYVYAERDGAICGVLPMVEVRSRLFGHSLASTPFCVYGGAVADDEATLRALEDHAAAVAEALGVDHLELRNLDRQREGWPIKDLYVTFRKAILPEVQQNMLAIPRKQRAMVRKGIDSGLLSEVEDHLDHFWPIYSASVRDHGTPVFPRRYFELLREVFGERCEITTVRAGGERISSVLSFLFRDEVLPYYGGGLPAARAAKAFDFMYWEVMRRACERGYRLFDYGRSKKGTGSYSFKKNWGFTPQPLPYQYHLVKARQIPDVNPLNPRYRMFIAMWQRLPLPVANRLGPLLARSLG